MVDNVKPRIVLALCFSHPSVAIGCVFPPMETSLSTYFCFGVLTYICGRNRDHVGRERMFWTIFEVVLVLYFVYLFQASIAILLHTMRVVESSHPFSRNVVCFCQL